MPLPEIQHLSYSSLSLYMACPEAWRRKYVATEPTTTTPALVFGTAFHACMELAVTERANPVGFWDEAWAGATAGRDVIWGADSPAHHYNEGVRVLGSPAVQDFAQALQPHVDEHGPWTERKVTLRVPGVDLPIIGYIDFLGADGVPGDFKTAAKAWPYGKAQAEIQPLFYLAALHQAGHDVPLRFRHYVVTKTKQVRVDVHEHERTWGEIHWLLEMIQRAWEGIRQEIFFYNPTSSRCSAGWCEFWHDCRGKHQA